MGLVALTWQGVDVRTRVYVTASSSLKNILFPASQNKDLFAASGESEDGILEP